MTTVKLTSSSGQLHEFELAPGQSLMRAALADGVEGIEAECGGCLTCATCHVYVEEAPGLPAPGDEELAMLDFVAAERKHSSRLSCQLQGSAELPLLRAKVPARQY
ncbi:MAG: 2Fe-2S iron-sulfur cluster binding domain-containing protein [Burkholderiales bacterium]|nr:2Fe-2S iron-sulfur cluster binding domain-containing protein [Burkholderiales bacterium]